MNDTLTLALIASPGHSGQTWLSLLIGSHTQALSLGEIDVIYRCTSLENACMLCGSGCEFWSGFNRVWSPGKNIFLQLAAYSGKRVLSISSIDKYRRHMLPDRMRLKVIRLLRDGRAVTASYLRKYPNRPYEEIVRQWISSAQQNDAWVEQFPQGNRLVMKYEDLLEDTAGWMRTVCDFLEIGFEQPMLEYWKVKHHIVDGNRGTLSFVRRYFGIGSTPADKQFYETQRPDSFRDERWRGELNSHQRYLFEKMGGYLNRHYGYESDSHTFPLLQAARDCMVRTRQRLKRIVS